jgi:hypothetical protein
LESRFEIVCTEDARLYALLATWLAAGFLISLGGFRARQAEREIAALVDVLWSFVIGYIESLASASLCLYRFPVCAFPAKVRSFVPNISRCGFWLYWCMSAWGPALQAAHRASSLQRLRGIV